MKLKILVLVALAGAVSGCNETHGQMDQLRPVSYTTEGNLNDYNDNVPFAYAHSRKRKLNKVGRIRGKRLRTLRKRKRVLYRPASGFNNLMEGISGTGVSLKRFASLRSRAKVSCLPHSLKGIIADISKRFGKKVIISSGHRSRRHNARVGGVKRSMHLSCQAVDLKVPGVSKFKVARFVRSLSASGGVGTYCGKGIVHVDVGPRRSWNYGCRGRYASSKKKRKKRTRR